MSPRDSTALGGGSWLRAERKGFGSLLGVSSSSAGYFPALKFSIPLGKQG